MKEEKEEDLRIRCFMDGVDWQYHLEADISGVKLYPDEDAVRADNKCVRIGGCGIVEVEVRLVRWVEEQTIGEAKRPPPK